MCLLQPDSTSRHFVYFSVTSFCSVTIQPFPLLFLGYTNYGCDTLGSITWLVAAVSSPSHRLINWAFIMAVASWSILERFLRKESNSRNYTVIIHIPRCFVNNIVFISAPNKQVEKEQKSDTYT